MSTGVRVTDASRDKEEEFYRSLEKTEETHEHWWSREQKEERVSGN